MKPRETGRSARQRVGLFLSTRPRLFYPVMRARSHYRDVLVGPRTEIVIEGYPRSANTFATVAFEVAQERSVAIGRHTHAAAQVIEGVRRALPTVVLLRRPEDAITSLLVRNPEISLDLALERYRLFYQKVAAYRNAVVVAEFETVVSDFGAIIAQVNERFGTVFKPYEHSPDSARQVEGIVEERSRRNYGGVLDERRVARPSHGRTANKAAVARLLQRSRWAPRLGECGSLYDEFAALARPRAGAS